MAGDNRHGNRGTALSSSDSGGWSHDNQEAPAAEAAVAVTVCIGATLQQKGAAAGGAAGTAAAAAEINTSKPGT